MNRPDWTHAILNELDPALVEEASVPRPHRSVRLRPALIPAACLCLLLLGTALASEGFTTFPTFRILQEYTQEGDLRLRAYRSGWEIRVQTRPLPLSAFSRQARSLPGDGQTTPMNNRYAMQGFDSLSEAEEFLGLELLDHPLLDSAQPVKGFSITQEDGSELPVYALLTRYWSEEDVLSSASLSTALRLTGDTAPETFLHMTISLRTEAASQSKEVVTTSLNRRGTSYRAEEYTAPSGLMAVLVEVTEPWEDAANRMDCIANFSYRGAAFRIQAYCPSDPDSALTTLKQILNTFE